MKLKNEEYYILFKKVSQKILLSEFTLDKMNIFKEKLNNLLKKFSDCRNPSDILILPVIFFLLKRSFYKLKKDNQNLIKQTSTQTHISSCEINKTNKNPNQIKYKDETEKNNFIKNGSLLYDSILIAFDFLDVNIPEDISLSALNFIHKFFEEPINFEYQEKFLSVN